MAAEEWIPVSIDEGRLVDERSTDLLERNRKNRENVEAGRTKPISCFEPRNFRDDPLWGVQAINRKTSHKP